MTQLGTYEFDLYTADFRSNSVRFALTWPSAWELVELALCNAILDSGEPWVRGSPLLLDYTTCRRDDRPFMRMVFNCTVPGRFSVVSNIASRECDDGYWLEEFFYYHWVEVGEYCGMLVQPICDFCQYELAGRFIPSSLNVVLPPEGTYTRTITVRGSWVWCGGIAECWGEQMPCSGGVGGDKPWISLNLIQSGDSERVYDLVVDADGLDPGVYQGRIYLGAICGHCKETCMPIELTVLDPSSTDEPDGTLPAFHLDPGQPSLFRDRSTLSFGLPREGKVKLQVFDVRGTLVSTLVDRYLRAGSHVATWMGQSDCGAELPSGVYFARLRLEDLSTSQRLIRIR
jgi:hypothetical protein